MARTPRNSSKSARLTGSMTAAPLPPRDSVVDVDISDVLQDNYRDYAAAVVVGRAIPDVRDGMKPVHRRIIYAMQKGGYDWSAQHRKSARIVGDILGQFHPHGDSSVYMALARLAQPWSVTAPLIDGQGNFGSPDGDSPAAMRYTEARLSGVARHLVSEITRDTVDFQPNYDETEVEPVVLPAEFPHILVNGGSGIAVGMASSFPTHNLDEVIQATQLRIREPACALPALMALLPGPDLPTAGRILGTGGILKAYETGRGTLDLEARSHVEDDNGATLLVFDDMPWGIAKPDVLARINALILEGTLPEVISARDESGRAGTRFVVEMKKGSDAAAVELRLKHLTPLRSTISLNFTALTAQGVPREMGLAEILDHWIAFRRITVRRRATFDLRKARLRGRLLLGRIAALSIIDKIVKMIRASKDKAEAMAAIMALTFARDDYAEMIDLLGTEAQKRGKRFSLNAEQAEDILAMRLQRLTGLERDSLEEEARTLAALIRSLREILADPARLDAEILGELEAIRTAHARPRLTEIAVGASKELPGPAARLLTPKEATFVEILPDWTVARHDRQPAPAARAGLFAADTHGLLVVFTDNGQSYGIKVADIPPAEGKTGGARPLAGLVGQRLDGAPVAATVFSGTDLEAEGAGIVLTFVSGDGMLRRTPASEFVRIPAAGKIAMKIATEDARLLTVFRETGDVQGGAALIATAQGKVIRFALGDCRVFDGRSSRGLRSLKLDAGDRVVSAYETPDLTLEAEVSDAWTEASLKKGGKTAIADPELLARLADLDREVVQVAASGHVKRTTLHAYRQSRRDGKGVNDRGPAKGIGEILALVPLAPGATGLFVETPEGPTELPLEAMKRRAKAQTGEKPVEAISRVFG